MLKGRYFVVEFEGRPTLVRVQRKARGIVNCWFCAVNVGSWGSYQRAERLLSQGFLLNGREVVDEADGLSLVRGGK